MKKTRTKFFGVGLVLALLVFGFVLLGNKAEFVFAENAQKNYSYTVFSVGGQIGVDGKYSNGQTYRLTNGVGFENVLAVIDEDRFVLGAYQPATVNFENVAVGNTYLDVANDGLTLSGTLSGLCYSTFGFIFVHGADVEFKNANFSNAGLSYLVKNDGAGKLTFRSGNFSAVQTTVFSRGEGDVSVLGGNFSSKNGSVIEFLPSTPAAKLEICGNQTTLSATSKTCASVVAKSAQVHLLGGKILNPLGTAVWLENANCLLLGVPQFLAKTAIETNTAICAKQGAETYLGETISIKFLGEVVSGHTAVVLAFGENRFALENEGFTLAVSAEQLVACKTYGVTYVDAKNLIVNLPQEQKKFLQGQSAVVLFPSQADMLPHTTQKFEFLGWSLVENSAEPTFTPENNILVFEEQDVRLYAVWRTLEFQILYVGVEGAENPNPTTYTSEQCVQFAAPTKQFYAFVGWRASGQTVPQPNLEFPAGTFGNKTLEAMWRFQDYNINYHNLPNKVVQELGLATTYNIVSQPIEVKLDKLMVLGYTYFGVFFDEEHNFVCDDKIFFAPGQQNQNSANFLATNQIGRDIDIFFDVAPYSNGIGNGTAEQPFQIDNFAQLKNLVVGKKLQMPVFVALAADISCPESFGNGFLGLENVVLDGQMHKLCVQEYTHKNGYIALFPSVIGSTIKNVVVECAGKTFEVAAKASFGGLAGYVAKSTLENISINLGAEFEKNSTPSVCTLKFGALAVEALGTTVNNVTATGSLVANFAEVTGDTNIYGAGLVGFWTQNCKFLNCESGINIDLSIAQTNFETRAYLAGLACVAGGNQIANCLVRGNIHVGQGSANWAYLCGIAMVFDVQNVLDTAVFYGKITAEGSAEKIVKEQFVPSVGITVKNAYCTQDFAQNSTATLKKLANALDGLQKNLNFKPKIWFLDSAGKLQFMQGIFVEFVGNEMMPNRQMYFENAKKAAKKAFLYDANKFVFEGWFLEDGKPVDWAKVDGPNLRVVAHYQLRDSVVFGEQMVAVAIELWILLLVVLAIVLFDMPKRVRFVQNGQEIGKTKAARRKKIELPKEFEGKICFLDTAGQKPFVKNRMPFHPLTLFVFEDKKQEALEKYWRELWQKQAEAKLEAKQKKQLQKKNILENRQTARQTKKQTGLAKKSTSKKVVQEDNSKITIIKKEIKVVKQNKDIDEE